MRLKKLRVGLAGLVFTISLGLFITGANSLKFITRLQLIPAVMDNKLLIIAGIGLLTILLGRIYCSIICPLGILQDLIISLRKRFNLKFSYRENNLISLGIRALVLGGFIVSFMLGLNLVINLADPYSNFGRVVINLLRPVVIFANNLAAAVLNFFDIYLVTNLKASTVGPVGLLLISPYFLLLFILSFLWGRIYCNNLCPIGLVLGFLARFSLFKVKINSDCTQCGACEAVCRASCLDSEEKTIDYQRCVNCFDCLEACPQQAVDYGAQFSRREERTVEKRNTKREFIGRLTSLGGGLALGLMGKYKGLLASQQFADKKRDPVLPPGAQSRKHFNDLCTACHLCVTKCPAQIIEPAIVEYGASGFLQPRLDFEQGFCDYDCNLCTQICPVNALTSLSLAEKKRTQLGVVQFFKEECIVYKNNKACGACAEHCSTKAIHQVEYKPEKNLRAPEVNPEVCIGCGACEHICPESGAALYVDGNQEHKQAKPPGVKEENQEETEKNFDDFGF